MNLSDLDTVFHLLLALAFWIGLVVVAYRIVKWVVVHIARLFGWTQSSPSGAGEEQVALEEAKLYVEDWRLFIVACAAKFAKSDGVVTKSEIKVVEGVFETLELTGPLRPMAIHTFQQAKNGQATLRACVALFRECYRGDFRLPHILIGVLIDIGHSDGAPNAITQQALIESVNELGFDYPKCLEDYLHRKCAAKPSNVDAAYTVLGCQPGDALNVIKDRYRKLVKDFHPDTIIGKNLAPDFVKFAEERFKQIQAAYETVMSARGTRTA